MKQLTEYKKNGYEFQLVKRNGDIAIFQGTKESTENWEVIHIQSHDGREIAGKYFEPAEYPPSNEQWGAKGWTCIDADAARKRFDAEIEKRNTPPTP